MADMVNGNEIQSELYNLSANLLGFQSIPSSRWITIRTINKNICVNTIPNRCLDVILG